jgi:hypothetical protein
MRHGFIRGSECNLGNSGIPFNEGFNFYSCACGKWRSACKGETRGRIEYSRHLETELQQDAALVEALEKMPNIAYEVIIEHTGNVEDLPNELQCITDAALAKLKEDA